MRISALKLIDRGTRPQYLVSVAFQKLKFLPEEFVNVPGSILASTLGHAVSYKNKKFYFQPLLFEDPSFTESIEPHKRQYSLTKLELKFNKYAQLPEDFVLSNGASGGILKVQLWVPGTDLSEAETIFLGSIDSVKQNPHTESYILQATDGEPKRSVVFPANAKKLDSELFPLIPTTVDGRWDRRTILGRCFFPIACPQVSPNTFYICDHKISNTTNLTVEVDGEIKSRTDKDFGWDLGEYFLPQGRDNIISNGQPLSIVVFKKDINPELDLVVVNNFTGVNTKNPLLTLLLDYGDYAISESAKQTLLSEPFSLTVLQQLSGEILKTVNDRLIPQTPYIMGWRAGKIELFHLSGIRTGLTLRTKADLLDIVSADSIELTDEADVINNLKIGYQRNVFSASNINLTRKNIKINYLDAPMELKSTLEFSFNKYGSRYFEMEFADLNFEHEIEYYNYITSLAKLILSLTAKQSRIVEFYAPFKTGLKLPINSVVKIHAPEYRINNMSARLIAKTYKPWGFILGFQEEFLMI